MARLDPDAIADELGSIAATLMRDCRTVRLGFALDDLRRDIARALATGEPEPRRVDPGETELARRAAVAALPCETARQARAQGQGDGLRVRDLESAVFAHGGRFVEVARNAEALTAGAGLA